VFAVVWHLRTDYRRTAALCHFDGTANLLVIADDVIE
jgi:hypothetical protein